MNLNYKNLYNKNKVISKLFLIKLLFNEFYIFIYKK